MTHGRRLRRAAALVAVVSFAASASFAPLVAQTAASDVVQLRLMPLLDGLREDAANGDLSTLPTTAIGKEAAKVGVDLSKPGHPLVVCARRDDRLFYVFYKVTEEAFGARAWMLQRIKKIERTWATAGSAPEEKVTWQVEAFKTSAGSLKGGDQHFGSFGLRGAHRREIVKEYEIGFGEIAGRAEGAQWPFAMERLFHMLQPYGDDAALHDAVTFTKSRKWSLTVALGADGSHRLTAPELGIDLPKQKVGAERARPKPDPASKAIVLVAGEGPPGVAVGKSTRTDVDRALGAPLEDVPAGPANRNCSYRGGLTCAFAAQGVLLSVFTRASFAGKTKEGLAHGMTRADVSQKLGTAAKSLPADGAQWDVPGLTVLFDAAGAVRRFVVTRRGS